MSLIHDDIIGSAYKAAHGADYARSAAKLRQGDDVTLIVEKGNGTPVVGAYAQGIKVGQLSPSCADKVLDAATSNAPFPARVTRVITRQMPFESAIFVGIEFSLNGS